MYMLLRNMGRRFCNCSNLGSGLSLLSLPGRKKRGQGEVQTQIIQWDRACFTGSVSFCAGKGKAKRSLSNKKLPEREPRYRIETCHI